MRGAKCLSAEAHTVEVILGSSRQTATEGDKQVVFGLIDLLQAHDCGDPRDELVEQAEGLANRLIPKERDGAGTGPLSDGSDYLDCRGRLVHTTYMMAAAFLGSWFPWGVHAGLPP